jgi:hypothetical protein
MLTSNSAGGAVDLPFLDNTMEILEFTSQDPIDR